MGINPQLKQNAEKSGGRKKETANIPKSDILKETTSLTAVDADININIRKKRALSTNLDWRNRSSCASLFHVRYQQCGDCWVNEILTVKTAHIRLYCNCTFFHSL